MADTPTTQPIARRRTKPTDREATIAPPPGWRTGVKPAATGGGSGGGGGGGGGGTGATTLPYYRQLGLTPEQRQYYLDNPAAFGELLMERRGVTGGPWADYMRRQFSPAIQMWGLKNALSSALNPDAMGVGLKGLAGLMRNPRSINANRLLDQFAGTEAGKTFLTDTANMGTVFDWMTAAGAPGYNPLNSWMRQQEYTLANQFLREAAEDKALTWLDYLRSRGL